MGPFAVSLDWTRAILQNRDVNSSGINDVFALSTDYVLGPGIDVGVGVDYSHYKSNAPNGSAQQVGGASYSGLTLMAGTGIAF